MALKQRLDAWEAYPLWTPRWILLFTFCYAAFFLFLGGLYLGASSSVQEVRIDFSPDAVCTGAEREIFGAVNVVSTCESVTLSDITHVSPSPTVVVEKIEFTLDVDLTPDGDTSSRPLLMYYEVEGLYTNHRRYIKSSGSMWPSRQTRTGSCMSYQKTRTECKDDPDWSLGPMSGEELDDAVYRLWNPEALQDEGSGCYLWWSERSEQCLKDGYDGSACKFDKLQNRAFYPCGLAAKLFYMQGADHLYLPPDSGSRSSISERAEDISFGADYKWRFRNLNPDGVFDAQKSDDPKGESADALAGLRYNQVLNMNPLLFWFPPVVCEDDPLRLMTPNAHPTATGPNCSQWEKFQFAAADNQADCEYPGSLQQGEQRSVLGVSTTCGVKIPNPAGWGVENSHWMNWQRLSGLSTFRKLYGKMTSGSSSTAWQKGTRRTVYVVNRMNMKQIAGDGHGIKKRVVFTTANWAGGQNYHIGIIFLIMGVFGLLLFAFLLSMHTKEPLRLHNRLLLDWKSHR